MATTFKVRYKNHCTPQEQITSDGRYYLDSDCGRKLTGVCDSSTTSNGTLTTGVSITTSTQSIVSSSDFVYLKNTGSETIYISLTTDSSAEYVISLQAGEAFASDISASANVRVKTASGTSTIEHFSIT
jgi:hypothetical protein